MLETKHLAFVDEYTRKSGEPQPAWDGVKFQKEVTAINTEFSQAQAAEQCPPRRESIANDAKLFSQDVVLLQQQHFFTVRGAANTKTQIKQNYDLFLSQR
jgi:hypothetical protein